MSINDLLDMNIIPLMCIICVILFAFLITISIAGKKQNKENLKKPIIESKARIISKIPNPSAQNGNIVVEFEDGERKEFFVYSKDFNFLCENDVGILKTQGNRVLEFKRIL